MKLLFVLKTRLVVLQIYHVNSVTVKTFCVGFVTIRRIKTRRCLLRFLFNIDVEYATCNARVNYEGSELYGTYQIRMCANDVNLLREH
jgi:hypothetical protein